jgi:hypothetical protein
VFKQGVGNCFRLKTCGSRIHDLHILMRRALNVQVCRYLAIKNLNLKASLYKIYGVQSITKPNFVQQVLQTCRCYSVIFLTHPKNSVCWSRWPRGQRRGFAAARLLGLQVRISPVVRISVACDCCVLSGRGLCFGLITRPEESYLLWCVWVWSWKRRPRPTRGCCPMVKKIDLSLRHIF